MKIATNIAVSAAVSILAFVGAYKYLPLNWLETTPAHHGFGSTITTINGTDTISSSRSVINTNFANLNADKIEATQTTLSSLSSIGTITSGTWHGTTLDPAYGGTGSTTLAKFNILLGSSTNPIGIVQGLGTSGQFLTSAGPGAPPAWQTAAIDQTANYNWTGLNLFKSFTASSTITFSNAGAGLSFNFATTRQASSTVLTEDGSGNVKFITPQVTVLNATSTVTTISGTTASTTMETVIIPANTLSNATVLHINSLESQTVNAAFFEIGIGNGSATTSIANNVGNSTQMDCKIYVPSSTSEQAYCVEVTTGSTAIIATSTIAGYNTAATIYLSFTARPSSSGSGTASYNGTSVILNRQ